VVRGQLCRPPWPEGRAGGGGEPAPAQGPRGHGRGRGREQVRCMSGLLGAVRVIGCTGLLAESGIPRTQPGRAGSGPGPQPVVDSLQQHYTYAVDPRLRLRHRSRLPSVPCGRARCHPAWSGPLLRHRSWPLTRPGGAARELWCGHNTTRTQTDPDTVLSHVEALMALKDPA
jgi:hypothetical protein